MPSLLCHDYLARTQAVSKNVSTSRLNRKHPRGRTLCGEIISVLLTDGEMCKVVPEMLQITKQPKTWSFLACSLISLALDINQEAPGSKKAFQWWSTFCSCIPKWVNIVRLNLTKMNTTETKLIALQSRSNGTINIVPKCTQFGKSYHYCAQDQERLCLNSLVLEIRVIFQAVFDWKHIQTLPKRQTQNTHFMET